MDPFGESQRIILERRGYAQAADSAGGEWLHDLVEPTDRGDRVGCGDVALSKEWIVDGRLKAVTGRIAHDREQMLPLPHGTLTPAAVNCPSLLKSAIGA